MPRIVFLCLLILLALSHCFFSIEALQVHGVAVHKVPLRHSTMNDSDTIINNDRNNPHCLAASSIIDLASDINFLATQVWPSARMASLALERHVDPSWTICEFGCGPGLPSLTAATMGCPKVIATDVDPFALELVKTAAKQQGLESKVKTRPVDLLQTGCLNGGQDDDDDDEDESSKKSSSWSNNVDLFVFSDVFENSAVAIGAAHITQQILKRKDDARVWVFAQTDRAQREIYLQQLRLNLDDTTLTWTSFDDGPKQKDNKVRLWLCDVDETKVFYG